MKQSLESLGAQLSLTQEQLETSMPGAFVKYEPVKKKSSDITLSSASGYIRKHKKRTPEKAIYEFLSLSIWNKVLEEYSRINELKFRAPKPVGLYDLEGQEPGIIMTYLNGYELQKINKLRRTTPVKLNDRSTSVPLYPACALYLGALNRLKEVEGLYHSDFGSRHVIFSPVENVSIGVVDVENSRKECFEVVSDESAKILSDFEAKTSSPKDLSALKSWYHEGQEGLIVPTQGPVLEKIIQDVCEEFGVHLDFSNGTLEGRRIIY